MHIKKGERIITYLRKFYLFMETLLEGCNICKRLQCAIEYRNRYNRLAFTL